MNSREIIADYLPHFVGEREVVDWTRSDGQTYRNVPVMYLRQVTREDYLRAFPNLREKLEPERCHFWEVSID